VPLSGQVGAPAPRLGRGKLWAGSVGSGEQAVRAARSRRSAAGRFAVLSEATALLAGSLDYEATLRRVARLAVPALADWCTVDVLEDDNRIERVAAAHADPSHEESVRETLRRYPMRLGEPRSVARVLRTGQSELQPRITDRILRDSARDARHLEILRSLGARSSIIVPLIARGRRLGALSFTVGRSGRRYGPADLIWADDLGARAALAIDNARLYGAARAAEVRLRAANEDLSRALRLRDDFIAAAAHELKTPLTTLQLWVQTLRRASASAIDKVPRLSRALLEIESESRRLTRLVERLIDDTSLEAGLTLARRPVDLAELARRVVDLLRDGAPGHAFAVDAPRPVVTSADPARLEQVLATLIENGVRFSPAGGAIEVSVLATDGEARVVVRDHGVGVPAERRASLFDRFQHSRGDHLGGLGLGLHLAQAIVKRHDGRIAAEHPDDGGTRFVVTLPIGEPPPTGAADA
jgi:signal transduction histidine kinase